MKDLTQYSDSELSLNVFNEEYFYIERHNRPYLMALIAEEFVYTPEQLEELIDDLNDDDYEGKDE
jgi:hypothetical protein